MGGVVGVPVISADGVKVRDPADLNADMLHALDAMRSDTLALVQRVAQLEARPATVAGFTATARLPNVAALASVTLTLTGLIPVLAGDRLKAGERVVVQPAAPLPAGLALAAVTAPADDTVAVQVLATVAVSSPVIRTWVVTALR